MPRASSARVILYSRARRAQRIVREIDFISCFAPITRALNTYIAPRHSYVPAPQFQGRQGPCIKHACSIKRANVRRATRRHPPSTNRRRSLSSIFETKKRETGKKKHRKNQSNRESNFSSFANRNDTIESLDRAVDRSSRKNFFPISRCTFSRSCSAPESFRRPTGNFTPPHVIRCYE